MSAARQWYERLSVECILALDAVLGDGPHSDALLLDLAQNPHCYDLSSLSLTDRTGLEGALRELRGNETLLERIRRNAGRLSPAMEACLDVPALQAGVIRNLEYAPGSFVICVGDVSSAASVEVEGRSLQPLGHIQPAGASQACHAWIVFDPEDPRAPVFLAESSGTPELLATSWTAFLHRLKA